jgi:Cu(I)/Ag(I) efflux system membrane fusion protein
VSFTDKLILSIALCAAFLAGYGLRYIHCCPASTGATRRPLYFHDPMHPAYKSDKPGVAPDCGMQLEPVYAEGPSTVPSDTTLPPGSVRISLDRQQIIGLRTATVVRSGGTHVIRVLGRVAADESCVHRVSALIDGVVRSVSPYAPGNLVRKDTLLASYFVASRDLFKDFQAYFVAMSALDQRASANLDPSVINGEKAQVRLQEELLKTYGVTETQMRELARTRQVTRDVEFRSPVTGIVLTRNAAPGQRVERGAELFRVADLERVWVLANLFENESGLMRAGAPARVHYRGRTYRTALGEAQQFDPVSRALQVRLDLDNPDLLLRPGMFVDVEFDAEQPEGLSVPVDAVIDSGRRKAVFVCKGAGTFEPREVLTGAIYGDRVQILSGIQNGESIVVAGLFLLDSESRLQLSAVSSARYSNRAVSAASDPVCGMDLGSARETQGSKYDGTMYRFCSRQCKAKFDANPVQFTTRSNVAALQGGQQ